MNETVKAARSRGGQLRMQLPDAAEHLARIQVLGGKAVAEKQPPERCPNCHRSLRGKSWHQYLRHLSHCGRED